MWVFCPDVEDGGAHRDPKAPCRGRAGKITPEPQVAAADFSTSAGLAG